MKKIILLFFIFVSISMSISAQTPKEIYIDANKQYEIGNFNAAIQLYKSLLKQDWQSSNLYYNLGNAYFKTGKNGLAILNYEKAKVLCPRDEDIKFNLEYVNALAIQSEEKQANFLTGFFVGVYDILSASELSILFTIVYFCLVGLICISFFRKNGFLRTPIIVLSVCAVIMGSWALVKISSVEKPYAVVIKPDSNIRSGPGIEYAAGYLLPEGKKILVLQNKEGWCEVGLRSESLKGWIEQENIEIIK